MATPPGGGWAGARWEKVPNAGKKEGVCVPNAAVTRVLAGLGVRGPVWREAGRRAELRTLPPTALVSTIYTFILAQGPNI